MGLFDRLRRIRTDNADRYIRLDFMGEDSKGITRQTFRAIQPQYKNLGKTKADYSKLSDWYKSNGICHTVVSKPAKDATRNGWRIVISGDTDKQAKYQKALDDLKLKQALSQELIYQRLHGDGYLHVAVEEAGNSDLSKPINEDLIKKVSFVNAFGETHVRLNQINQDPTNENYGKEVAVILEPVEQGDKIDENGNAMPQPIDNDPVIIDKSRYFHISLDKMEDDVVGTSIVTRCEDQIKTLDVALNTAGTTLFEYAQKVLKSNRLADLDDEEFLRQRNMLSQGMTTEAVVYLGEDEDLTKVTTPVTGMDNLFKFAWQQLATASGIPQSVLMGEQAGTLAGASQDVINYYDDVNSIQEDILRPQIEYIIKLLMKSSDVADGYDDPDQLDWKLEFNPLWSPDDKTQAETFATIVHATAELVTSGIKRADQAEEIIDGQANNQNMVMQRTDSADNIEHDLQSLIDDGRDLEDMIHEEANRSRS